MVTGGEAGGKLGAWGQCTQIAEYKIDNQQGPTVQYRELYLILCDNIYEEKI